LALVDKLQVSAGLGRHSALSQKKSTREDAGEEDDPSRRVVTVEVLPAGIDHHAHFSSVG
jgi:hypothetical protein